MPTLSPATRRRLEIQGFSGVGECTRAETAPWLRLAFAPCTALAAAGTLLASPVLLWSLVPIAAWAATFPVHPFDLLYNHGLRRRTGTGPFTQTRRSAPVCLRLGSPWLIVTGWAFHAGAIATGYVLGALLTLVGRLVSTTGICIPALAFAVFPPKSSGD